MTDLARITARFPDPQQAEAAVERARAEGLLARREDTTPAARQQAPSPRAVAVGGALGLVLGAVGGAAAYVATGFTTPDPGKLIDHGGMFLLYVVLASLTVGAMGAAVGLAFARRRDEGETPQRYVVRLRVPPERVDEARSLLGAGGAQATTVG